MVSRRHPGADTLAMLSQKRKPRGSILAHCPSLNQNKFGRICWPPRISEIRRSFRPVFFQLTVNPQLDPPLGKQLKRGLGLAGHDPVADPELPLPDPRSNRRYGVFDTSVDHAKSPAPAIAGIQSENVT
jgi:hypothetical protein